MFNLNNKRKMLMLLAIMEEEIMKDLGWLLRKKKNNSLKHIWSTYTLKDLAQMLNL
jgi:hypothetical protein